MINISQNVNTEILEKLPDGTYRRKYPKTTKSQVGLGNVDNIKQATKTEFDSHAEDTSNPHSVTKSQVGLGNVDNTTDLAKPISTATQAVLDLKANDNEVVKLSGDQTIEGDTTLDGDTVITGNLTVSGDNFIAETTTVRTDDDLIELRSKGTTPIATPAGIAIRKYDGVNDGGIVIKDDGEVRVGKITIDTDGKVSDHSEAQPVLTRAEKNKLTNDDLLVWDLDNNRAVTKTLTALGIVNTTTLNNHTSNKENPHEVTAEQVDTYVKTTIDNKDANTLQEAKDYTYSQTEIDLKVSTINIKQDKLVAGENITIDPNTNVISSKIKEQNKNTDIKFWTGSQTEYDSLGTTDETTLYFIEEE